MASNTITPDKVKTFLSTFLSSNTKESKTEKNVEVKSDDEKKEAVLSPIESAAKFDYFKRVETYSPMTWFGKPKELSPLICARYGWENSVNDMLQCVSCRAVLSGQLPSTTEFDLYKESCDKLLEKLISGHEKLCWVAANPTSERFMILPLYDVVQLKNEFHERLCQLAKIKTTLPKLNFENLEKWGFDEEKCTQLATSQHIREDAAISATLAITGWTLGDSIDIIRCNYCKRRIGLWNYETKDTVCESTTDDEPSSKRIKLERKTTLDPIMEHRYWCPWVTMETTPSKDSLGHDCQSFDDSINSTENEDVSFTFKRNEKCPGWVNTLKILVPVIAETVGSTGLSDSPMIDGIRSVRKILRVWSSPEKPADPDSSTESDKK
ncbi:zinc finger C3HC-type protein 1 [Patella vulgata]|uniref:zinc finger C3HC-type protein 1 n=1 Tax=Patella vulgata TaxID=6465 RepID=UPI00217FC226|nr:zinc finger C3HC-type protein 1 [Patella vulgata]